MNRKRIALAAAAALIVAVLALYFYGLGLQGSPSPLLGNIDEVLALQAVSLYAPLHEDEPVNEALCSSDFGACIERYSPTAEIKEACLKALRSHEEKKGRIQTENPLLLALNWISYSISSSLTCPEPQLSYESIDEVARSGYQCRASNNLDFYGNLKLETDFWTCQAEVQNFLDARNQTD